jgi:hypothetical protein
MIADHTDAPVGDEIIGIDETGFGNNFPAAFTESQILIGQNVIQKLFYIPGSSIIDHILGGFEILEIGFDLICQPFADFQYFHSTSKINFSFEQKPKKDWFDIISYRNNLKK